MGSSRFGVGPIPFNTMGTTCCKSFPVGYLHPQEGLKQFIQALLLPRLCQAAAELKGLSFGPSYDALLVTYDDFWSTFSLTQEWLLLRQLLIACSLSTCQSQHDAILTTGFHFPGEKDTLPDKLFEKPFILS